MCWHRQRFTDISQHMATHTHSAVAVTAYMHWNSVLNHITPCRYGRRAQVTTARNLKDYAAIVDALVSQPNVLREYRQYAPVTRDSFVVVAWGGA